MVIVLAALVLGGLVWLLRGRSGRGAPAGDLLIGDRPALEGPAGYPRAVPARLRRGRAPACPAAQQPHQAAQHKRGEHDHHDAPSYNSI